MGKLINLYGNKFGRWVVISEQHSLKNGEASWLCKCECGTERMVCSKQLRNGKSNSCGCYMVEEAKKRFTKHGLYQSSEYSIWVGLIQRCTNPESPEYHNYGGRGITVCGRWLNSFENFYEDMGKRPSLAHTIDRFPNNEDGNYELSNCRWATDYEQNRNKRTNILVEYNGEKFIMSDLAIKLGMPISTLRNRIKKGWNNYNIIHGGHKREVRGKIVLDLCTGIYYDSAKEAATAKNIDYTSFIRKLNGYYTNHTSMVYV